MDDRAVDLGIGRVIRAVRVRHQLRQSDVAERAGTSQQTVSRLETGKLKGVTLDTLRRVARELGVVVTIRAQWQGAELDRLLGARHSAMHELLARM